MAEVLPPEKEIRFRNVTLHSQERKEHGTLYLFRHHLLFSYLPDARHIERTEFDKGQNRGTASTESSGLTDGSEVTTTSTTSTNDPRTPEHVPNGGASASKDADGADEKRKFSQQKQRPKEIWVPYPLINHCILRPSHLQGQSQRPREDDTFGNAGDRDSELFPPTFGTATYERPSTDSARLGPYASPYRPSSPSAQPAEIMVAGESGRQPAIRIKRKDFQMMALHFHPSQSGTSADETARQAFYVLRSRCCVDRIQNLHAFHYRAPKEEVNTHSYDARREFARMGISGKAAEGPGTAWRISDINRDYSYSATYPSVLCVPRTVSDNMLKYGGSFRSRSRIPCLAYLHSNGGSITRSSQPMVGVQNKRNPQDERLVSAIFSSHTPLHSPTDSPPQVPSVTSPSSATLDSNPADTTRSDGDVPVLPISQSETALDEKASDKSTPLRKKIYGSTRRNMIVDARPKINALANRATGGGIEDVANYGGTSGTPVEKVFLNIANIHVMRASLEKVFDSFANSDYIKIKPDQEALRKSGWLGHIANMLDGAEMVARVVGLGGSHVLVHCSDGWDRTAQVSALAQIMLDPHYRTLDGFITLVQKDFESFGHKFKDRNGIQGSEKWFEIENERIAPSRTGDSTSADPNSLNAIGAKALSGAKNWFEKNRSNLFRQQNASKDSLGEQPPSRPASPPPNPLLHSPPSGSSNEEKGHRISEKEVSPIFHQILDAVYQLQHQCPNAFEFNERFLRRLFYHTYACQYMDFLFNCEKERSQYSGKLPSVWSHFLARRADFVNPTYVAENDDPLLFPKRHGVEREVDVRWWFQLFGRKDEEMNVPRALAPAEPLPGVTTTSVGSSISFDEQAVRPDEAGGELNGGIKESKSTPSLDQMADGASNRLAAMSVQGQDDRLVGKAEQIFPQHTSTQSTNEEAVMEAHNKPVAEKDATPREKPIEYDGDPLGVMASNNNTKPAASERLDFAAFASQNAFRE